MMQLEEAQLAGGGRGANAKAVDPKAPSADDQGSVRSKV